MSKVKDDAAVEGTVAHDTGEKVLPYVNKMVEYPAAEKYVTLNFAGRPELLVKIQEDAAANFRTIEDQIMFMLNFMLKKGWSKKKKAAV
jgi:hypothetical protein